MIIDDHNLRYSLTQCERNGDTAVLVVLTKNEPWMHVEQPLLRCDELKAIFELWLKVHARDPWSMGYGSITFASKRDAQKFMDRFASANGQSTSFAGSTWMEPPPLAPDHPKLWFAVASDPYGNGFQALGAQAFTVPYGMNYLGIAVSNAAYAPPQQNFSWFPITNLIQQHIAAFRPI